MICEKSWMSIREIEHQDLKVWNLKEKRKIKGTQKMFTRKKKKKYISKSKFMVYLQAEQQQRSINSYTEQKQQNEI